MTEVNTTENIVEEIKQQVKPKRAKAKPVEPEVKTDTEQAIPEYDLYKLYQDYFEAQQRQTLINYTNWVNILFGWMK